MRGSIGLVLVLVGTAYGDPEIVAPSDVAPAPPPMYTHWHPDETSGMFVEVGGGITHIDIGPGYQAKIVSFTPQTTFHRNFYLGPEVYVGEIDTTTGPDQAAMGGTTSPMHITGDVAGLTLVAGARTMAGMFSGALEVAGGIRYISMRDNNFIFTSLENRALQNTDGIIEARARVDAWVTPHLSIGAIVGKSLDDASSMTVALRLGVHLEAYDHTR